MFKVTRSYVLIRNGLFGYQLVFVFSNLLICYLLRSCFSTGSHSTYYLGNCHQCGPICKLVDTTNLHNAISCNIYQKNVSLLIHII